MTDNYYIVRSVGDLIYAMPAIHARSGGGIIYHGMSLKIHAALKPLIDLQPGFQLRHESEGLPPGFINLEGFRYRPYTYSIHLCETFGLELGVTPVYKNGWLCVPASHPGTVAAIVNITPRYRDKVYNWWRELNFLKAERNGGDLLFVGEQEEYKAFTKRYPGIQQDVAYRATADFLEAATMIKSAKYFSGTQSACLAIAEGLGRTYRFERGPSADNTFMGIERETVINTSLTRGMHVILANGNRVIKHFRRPKNKP